MTHQNHQTNGASLEDCHTNFYALTELYGIKWRKLVWGESNGNGGGGDVEGAAPLADPVISSYARCLAGDILCVWRRVPTPPPPQDLYDMSVPPPPPPPPLSLRSAKELWIFWYGEEPDLSGMVAPELMASQGEQGSWESGLSYECRSLLFKALHNLIERCLLSRDFVRLGKWFVQPYDGDEEDVEKSPWHLSFSFAFFLHGESTVCASVDVRQHPPVRTLTAKRLARVARLAPPDNSEPHADAKVILAPFGLEASLTGREWSETDTVTTRLLDAWRQLYPLEPGCGAIEVICGGVRMRYPSPYVLAASLEYDSRDSCLSSATSASDIADRTMRALTNTQPHRAMEVCSEAPDVVKSEGDFFDPTRKTLCTCAKCRRPRRPRPAPFHRRPHRPHRPHRAQPHESHASGVVCSPVSCGGGSPPQASSAPPSAGTQPVSPALTTAQHTATTHTNIAHTQSTTCVPTTMHTPAPTPDPLAPPTPAPPQRHYPQGGESPLGGGTMETCTSELLKRPALPPILPPAERRPDPLEDEACLRMLYDYTSVHAWLEHPVKRFKSESVCWRECMGTSENTDDLYAGHTHATEPQLVIKQERPDVDEIKEYKNLFTSDGLCPTLKDLEQIFDNSDDAASGDETVRLLQVQTPPDSNKSSEETRCSGNPGGRPVRPEELSKMFPTPPSMEAHAQPSPGFTMVDDNTHTIQPLRHNQAGSPQPDPIEDWSYVFKPPTVSKYVGSSKYAPLTSLPSQLLPPVPLPSHAVYRPRGQQDHRHTHSNRPAQDNNPPRAPLPAPTARSAPAPRSPPAQPPAPRACPVLLNVLLADTVLNLFRDHNFDSCTLCVCGAEPKAAGNIRGADAATYLPPATDDTRSAPDDDPDSPRTRPPPDEDPVRCSCGFSAVLNRRLAHDAGLFYEDEMEITGAAADPAVRSGGDGGALRDVAEAVLQQVCAPGGAASALCRAAARELQRDEKDPRGPDLLEYLDGGDAAARALRAASVSRPPDKPRLHRWPFAGGRGPRSSRDVVRLMRRLRPLLQDAIQKRCCGARMWDGVSGPLTWRQFHRLAGRGNEDLCEPQPVPPVLVGHERDWLALSPYALRHWERLGLEPYSYARDVAYVVLAPAETALTRPLLTFFRELSAAYETCRLGRHAPLTRVVPDGLLRASALAATPDTPPDEWLPELPNGALGDCIRAYSDKLRTKLVPQMAGFTLDHTVFESDTKSGLSHMERPAPSPMRPPSTPDHPPTPNSQSDQESESPVSNNNMNGSQGASLGGTSLGGGTWETEERGAPILVIYIVEPPGTHTQPTATLHALMRLGTKLAHHLHQHKPLVKVISLEGVWATSGIGGGVWAGEMKALAFSVFSGARRLLTHTANGKSLTGFGTAANASLMLKAKDEKNRAPYKLYTPAYVLAPGRTLKDAESWAGAGALSAGQDCAVLFLAYCLSHDQRWLLAAATDARGELLDTALIDIHVPARARRRQAPARRLGLAKLMDFTLGVMSQSAQPWRLVVGRVGRIGHGELKSWSSLLSRKNLARASTVLREICGSCTVLYPGGAPCILSACLVSTEPDSRLRLMADRFTPDERFSQASIASHLHTPRDVTATHILVFPTSATTQSNQMPFEPPMANGEDGDMNFLGVDMGEEDMGEDNISDLFMGDMFNSMWAANSPRRNDDDVPSPQREQHHNPAYAHGDDSASEPAGTVLQQPLALGYLVSTAPLRGMPGWWWGSSGHLREGCPAFLKTALHLHIGTHDDYSSLTTSHHQHPLDSSTTTDVLRHVLEGYNALSWLALDRAGRDRASCLPLHVQALMRLYHAAAALA